MAITVDMLRETQSWKSATGRGYTRLYLATVTGDRDVTARSVRVAAGVPDIGDAHPVDATAKVTDVRATKDGDEADSVRWIVTVQYATPDRRTPNEDPLDDDVQITWGFLDEEEIVTEDIFGAVTNSAGDYFDPPATRRKHLLTLTVVRNEAAYAPGTAASYINHVNSAATTLCGYFVAAGQALCTEYSGELSLRGDSSYWKVTYRFEFRPEGFIEQLLDIGWYDSDGAPATDPKGGEPTKPMPLDGAGSFQTPPYVLVLRNLVKYDSVPFAGLGLNI